MDILKNAKAHFYARRELRGPIVVPEWGDDEGNPAEIYYQVPTIKERMEILSLDDNTGFASLVMALIILAKDKNGNQAFAKAQKAELLNSVDGNVLQRVVSEMRITDIPDDLGNS